MTISARTAAGISVAAFSLSLVLAPAAFAGDPMKQDIDFRNGISRDDGARRDVVPKLPVKKDDAIRKYGALK